MKSTQFSAIVALIFCISLAFSGNLSGKEPSKQWTQWRGPDRTGHIDPALPWPTSLKDGELDRHGVSNSARVTRAPSSPTNMSS